MITNKIYNEDCLETFSKIKNNSINLIITSPPYNKNHYSKKISKGEKKYAVSSFRKIQYDVYEDSMNAKEYEKWQKKILNECIRVLKEDGSIFYNHMDIQNNRLIIHPTFIYDYPVKQILIWDRANTPKLDKNYFYPITEYIFWIKKNNKAKTKFNRSSCSFQKQIIRLTPDTKNNHPAPYPIQLANNFILACTEKNDLVYDPFMGSGTTAIAAIINKRNYIGSEISKKYVDVANKRIDKYKNQTSLF